MSLPPATPQRTAVAPLSAATTTTTTMPFVVARATPHLGVLRPQTAAMVLNHSQAAAAWNQVDDAAAHWRNLQLFVAGIADTQAAARLAPNLASLTLVCSHLLMESLVRWSQLTRREVVSSTVAVVASATVVGGHSQNGLAWNPSIVSLKLPPTLHILAALDQVCTAHPKQALDGQHAFLTAPHLYQLEELHLRYTFAQAIPGAVLAKLLLGMAPSIRVLSLENLPDSFGQIAAIFPLLCNLEQLHLDLSRVHGAVVPLPTGLWRLPRLSLLTLRNVGLRDVPSALCLSPTLSMSLRDLVLSRNQLFSLPREFSRLRQLRHLDLGSNGLLAFDSAALSDALAGLASLEELLLCDCRLYSLPSWMSRLCSLRLLDVRANMLSTVPADFYALHLEQFRGETNPWYDLDVASRTTRHWSELQQLLWLRVQRQQGGPLSLVRLATHWINGHRELFGVDLCLPPELNELIRAPRK